MTHAVYSAPRIVPAGDAAILVEVGDGVDETVNRFVHALTVAIERDRPRGIRDLIPTYRALLISYDPLECDPDQIGAAVSRLWSTVDPGALPSPRELQIPTCYGGGFGPDLPFVASHNRLTPDEVVRMHSAGTYGVYMMGFSPGFAYLGGLDPKLATPRLRTPRTSIPAGSVGIAQQQTGIYPVESPGGWQLIGRTPARLFDASRTPPTLIVPGDRIRFVPIDEEEFQRLDAAEHEAERARRTADAGGGQAERGKRQAQAWEESPAGQREAIEVLSPGALTTIQDSGRYGYQRFGVPVSGAMDSFALRVGNLLVGNEEHAAALEMTMSGAEIGFLDAAVVCVTGADFQPRLDDLFVPMWTAVPVPAGSVLSFRGLRGGGARTYLAVSGGIGVPEVLGSRSTYLRARLGGLDGRALQAGDRLALASSGAALVRRLDPARPVASYMGGHRLRVVLGPQHAAFTAQGIATLLSSAYVIAPASDRMGYRLAGPPVQLRGAADIVSDGTPAGAVQVAGDGLPLVLLADRGTTGGYAKIATVISADLPRLAQCRPGDRVFFDAVTVRDAHAALGAQEAIVARIRAQELRPCEADGHDARQPRSAAAMARRIDERPRPVVARAPLPGKVLEVCVQAGEPVGRGQRLCVLEAMKMHNVIAAPRAGRVAAVRVQAGDQVAEGQALVDID